jgi:hypothetical protein
MAVAIEMRFPVGSLEQYDQVIEKMGFTPNGIGAPDGYFHWVAKTDDGLLVIDVWKDLASFQAFAESTMGPITQEVGVQAPQITVHQVHNMLSYAALPADA